jgi:transcriptional regulator with XRE-family HTH domain
MMTAEHQGDLELTNQQKYNRLRPKMIVEVRLLSHAGAEEKWFQAKIKDTNKEGAYCQITGGTLTRFWHWREIRPCEATEQQRATATLGEVAQTHLKPVSDLPRREPLPAPPALRAALVPTAAPSPPASLVRLTRPEQQQQAQPDEPQTAGEMIRRARMAAGITQGALADKIARLTSDQSFTNKRLSAIEVGIRPPSEPEQLAIVEALGIDLAQLIAACERDAARRAREDKSKRERERAQRRRIERAAIEGRTIAPRSSPYRPREALLATPSPAPSKRAATRAAQGGTLEDLIDALIAIVPMPVDAAERRNWFRCARDLFALSGER